MRDRWDRFSNAELDAISSALWTTSELYPSRLDHDVMVALREEATPLVVKRVMQNFSDDQLRSELVRRDALKTRT